MNRILMEKVNNFIYSRCVNMYRLQLKLINLPTYPTPKKEIFKNSVALHEEVA